MKKNIILLLFIFTLFSACEKPDINTSYKQPSEDTIDVAAYIVNADWEVTEVSEEVVWKYYHFDDLFSSTQSITVLDIDLGDENVTVDIPYVTSGFMKTSEAGTQTGAIAAINGSFFNTSKGGSTVFFKKDGKVINATVSGFDPFRENAGFAIDVSGDVDIVPKPQGGWKSVEAHTLLASGPLLVYDGKPVDLQDKDFNTDTHPRTAVGVTADNHLIAVVVDGRDAKAAGMTNEQLATVMDALGCEEAMNLDGGGSSTAWVKGEGVVNYPSDNDTFDHGGERGVATVISFILQK